MTSRFINPVPQFLDDAGDPLPNGLVYFYENDTVIAKNTYADANLTILNANPLPLNADGTMQNCFYNGTARVIVTYDDGSGEEQHFDKSGVGLLGDGSAFSIWNSITEYGDGALVEGSDGEYYRSLQANNQGNDPTSSTAFWEQVNFLRSWNTNVTYSINEFVIGDNGKIYTSLQNSNSGNTPSTATAWWELQNPFDQQLNEADDVIFNTVDIQGTTDSSSSTTGALKTAGGLGVAKALYVGTTGTFSGALDVTGTTTLGRDLILDSDANIYSQILMAGTDPTSTNTRRAMVCNSGIWYLERYNSSGVFQANDIAVSTSGDTTFSGTVRKNGTHPMVSVRYSTPAYNTTGDGTTYIFNYNTEVVDQGGDFSSTTFTAPVTGQYLVTGVYFLYGLTSSHTSMSQWINTSNRTWLIDQSNPWVMSGGSNYLSKTFSQIVDMDASDTLTVSIGVGGGTKVVNVDGVAATHTALQVTLIA